MLNPCAKGSDLEEVRTLARFGDVQEMADERLTLSAVFFRFALPDEGRLTPPLISSPLPAPLLSSFLVVSVFCFRHVSSVTVASCVEGRITDDLSEVATSVGSSSVKERGDAQTSSTDSSIPGKSLHFRNDNTTLPIAQIILTQQTYKEEEYYTHRLKKKGEKAEKQ